MSCDTSKAVQGSTLHAVLYEIVSLDHSIRILCLNPRCRQTGDDIESMLNKDPEQRPQSMKKYDKEL